MFYIIRFLLFFNYLTAIKPFNDIGFANDNPDKVEFDLIRMSNCAG
jgi:hypothetical protein